MIAGRSALVAIAGDALDCALARDRADVGFTLETVRISRRNHFMAVILSEAGGDKKEQSAGRIRVPSGLLILPEIKSASRSRIRVERARHDFSDAERRYCGE